MHVTLVTCGLPRRRVRGDVSGRRAVAVVANGAVSMTTVARAQVHLVVDLADETFGRDGLRLGRFVCRCRRLAAPAAPIHSQQRPQSLFTEIGRICDVKHEIKIKLSRRQPGRKLPPRRRTHRFPTVKFGLWSSMFDLL